MFWTHVDKNSKIEAQFARLVNLFLKNKALKNRPMQVGQYPLVSNDNGEHSYVVTKTRKKNSRFLLTLN